MQECEKFIMVSPTFADLINKSKNHKEVADKIGIEYSNLLKKCRLTDCNLTLRSCAKLSKGFNLVPVLSLVPKDTLHQCTNPHEVCNKFIFSITHEEFVNMVNSNTPHLPRNSSIPNQCFESIEYLRSYFLESGININEVKKILKIFLNVLESICDE